ncbi:MAG: hypothetical protein JO134_20600 [Xanthobacteraceae bacterium]|nr:hypothetical protein [Xanthobacteraceae bacterium]
MPPPADLPLAGNASRFDPTTRIASSNLLALTNRSACPIAALKSSEMGFDLIVDFIGGLETRRDLAAATVGISFRNSNDSAELAAFWDVYRATPASSVRVICHEVDGSTLIVGQGSVTTDIRSPAMTSSALLWKASAMLSSAVRQYGGLEASERRALAAKRFDQTLPSQSAQTANALVRMMLRAKILSRRALMPGSLVRDQWQIAIRRRTNTRAWGSADWHRGFDFIKCASSEFWADPFLFEEKGETWLFFENYDRSTRNGRIACGRIDQDGQVRDVNIVIENLYHMSNPLIFRHADEIIMIPETMAARRVEMYRCRDFPFGWDRSAILLDDIDMCDPIPIDVDGHWWLFGNVVGRDGSSWNELHLFHAGVLTGPWIPHPLNPVIADVRTARPGGRMFWQDGVLFRYAQDCGGGYGSRLHLCRIDELTQTSYHQTVVATIDPFELGMNGVHAYDAGTRYEVIDARHYQISYREHVISWPPPRWLGFH